MLCNNNNVCGEMGGCSGNSFGGIVNLIIVLIVLQFLTSIINGNGYCGSCC